MSKKKLSLSIVKMAFAVFIVILYAAGLLPEWALMSVICGMGFALPADHPKVTSDRSLGPGPSSGPR